MKAHIVYRTKPMDADIEELKSLMPMLEVTMSKLRRKELCVTHDKFYDIYRLDWEWLNTLFDEAVDVRCLCLDEDDLNEIGVKQHWGFYSLDFDSKHQFYMTNLDTLDPRAKKNGFKSSFAWMFVHEYLHGAVWETSRDLNTAAALVHEWEAQGVLKARLEDHVVRYDSLVKKLEELQAKKRAMKYQKLEIYRPTISRKVTQGWGENRACVWPSGKITGTPTRCPAGSQSFYRSVGLDGHNGIDISAWVGEDVYHAATFPGWWSTEVDNMGGIGVDVVSNEPLFFAMPIPTELINTAVPHEQDGVQGFTHYVKMRYWHLKAPVGYNKKPITCGTVVGLAGNTGASSGPHLHFSPKWCLKDGRGVGQNNGYAGAFDGTPYTNYSVTAKEHDNYLEKKSVPLSVQESKDILQQLSMLQQLILTMQKLKNNI